MAARCPAPRPVGDHGLEAPASSSTTGIRAVMQRHQCPGHNGSGQRAAATPSWLMLWRIGWCVRAYKRRPATNVQDSASHSQTVAASFGTTQLAYCDIDRFCEQLRVHAQQSDDRESQCVCCPAQLYTLRVRCTQYSMITTRLLRAAGTQADALALAGTVAAPLFRAISLQCVRYGPASSARDVPPPSP